MSSAATLSKVAPSAGFRAPRSARRSVRAARIVSRAVAEDESSSSSAVYQPALATEDVSGEDANAAAKKLSPKRKRPALKKSASAPANLSPPKPGAACRARAAARAAREQREAGLAAGDEFLEAQMKRMGISGGALRVERKHRYARALEKPSGYDARRKATPPAPPELHLANHERLLKKYERLSLIHI